MANLGNIVSTGGQVAEATGSPIIGAGLNFLGSLLPKPPTTPTGQTGVATSDLANNTLGVMHGGANDLMNAVNQHAVNKASNPGFDPNNSVVDLLTSKGMPSDYASRANLAKQSGISNYSGTAQQNKQLMGFVNSQNPQDGSSTTGNPPPQTPAAPGSSSGTQNQSTTNQTTTSTDATQNPFVNTGLPGDVENNAANQVFNQQGQLADSVTSQLQAVHNGTVPLTAIQQSQINAATDQFDQVRQLQYVANKSMQGGTAEAMARSGMNIGNPVEAAAEQNQAISDGLNKINNLDAEATKTIGALQQAFMDSDTTAIMQQYQIANDTLTAKAAAIASVTDKINSAYEWNQDFNQKANQFAATQKQAQDTAMAKYAPALATLGNLDPNSTIKSNIGGQGKILGFRTAKNKLIGGFLGSSVSLPNTPNLTVSEAQNAVIEQMATEMGITVPAAQQIAYQSNPQYAAQSLQTYYSSSTENQSTVEKLAQQGLTPAQILQIVNPQ